MAILWRASINKVQYFFNNLARLFILGLGPVLVVTATAIVTLCAVVFFKLVCPFLSSQNEDLNWLVTAHKIMAVYFILQLMFHYFYCIFAGPGIVTEDICQRLSNMSRQQFREQFASKINSNDKEAAKSQIWKSADGYRYKMCFKCRLPKPDRAHHCSVCNVCVLKMDHHCPWLHNCVGLQNHRSFFLFLFWLVFADFYFVIVSYPFWYAGLVLGKADAYILDGSALLEDSSELLRWKTMTLLAFLLAGILSLVLFAFVAHTAKLFLSGETSIENAQNAQERLIAFYEGSSFINDYNLGPFRNALVFFSVFKRTDWLLLFVPLPVKTYTNGLIYPQVGDLFTARDPLSIYRGHSQFSYKLLPM